MGTNYQDTEFKWRYSWMAYPTKGIRTLANIFTSNQEDSEIIWRKAGVKRGIGKTAHIYNSAKNYVLARKILREFLTRLIDKIINEQAIFYFPGGKSCIFVEVKKSPKGIVTSAALMYYSRLKKPYKKLFIYLPSKYYRRMFELADSGVAFPVPVNT